MTTSALLNGNGPRSRRSGQFTLAGTSRKTESNTPSISIDSSWGTRRDLKSITGIATASTTQRVICESLMTSSRTATSESKRGAIAELRELDGIKPEESGRPILALVKRHAISGSTTQRKRQQQQEQQQPIYFIGTSSVTSNSKHSLTLRQSGKLDCRSSFFPWH